MKAGSEGERHGLGVRGLRSIPARRSRRPFDTVLKSQLPQLPSVSRLCPLELCLRRWLCWDREGHWGAVGVPTIPALGFLTSVLTRLCWSSGLCGQSGFRSQAERPRGPPCEAASRVRTPGRGCSGALAEDGLSGKEAGPCAQFHVGSWVPSALCCVSLDAH